MMYSCNPIRGSYTQTLGFEDVFKRHVMASPVDRLIHSGSEV